MTEFGIDGMKYYFSWERIKEQHGGGGQKLFVFVFFFVHYIYCTTLLIYGIVKRIKKNYFE